MWDMAYVTECYFYSFSKLPLFIWQVIGLVENPSDQYLGNLTTNGRPWLALVLICIYTSLPSVQMWGAENAGMKNAPLENVIVLSDAS